MDSFSLNENSDGIECIYKCKNEKKKNKYPKDRYSAFAAMAEYVNNYDGICSTDSVDPHIKNHLCQNNSDYFVNDYSKICYQHENKQIVNKINKICNVDVCNTGINSTIPANILAESAAPLEINEPSIEPVLNNYNDDDYFYIKDEDSNINITEKCNENKEIVFHPIMPYDPEPYIPANVPGRQFKPTLFDMCKNYSKPVDYKEDTTYIEGIGYKNLR